VAWAVAAIHAFDKIKTWMPGAWPGMAEYDAAT
jgi:hypothetical protein